MNQQHLPHPSARSIAAWAVHAFTASTAIIGLLTLYAIYQHEYLTALWLMGAAIFVDAVDGTLARWVKVKTFVPSIDGALLDNIVDYLNYVITPCFFLLVHEKLLLAPWHIVIVSAIVLASAYQFTQTDAKTPDHFFKGFPSYWNIVVFYLVLFETSPMVNALVLSVCVVLVFVPIKYVYPSRLDYLTELPWLRKLMMLASIVYGLVCVAILWNFPDKHPLLIGYSLLYIVFYLGASLYRTVVPMRHG